MTSPSHPDYFRRVLDIARHDLTACCAGLGRPAGSDRIVDLRVETALDMPHHDEQVLRSDAMRIGDQYVDVVVHTEVVTDPHWLQTPPYYAIAADLRPAPGPAPAPGPSATLSDRRLLTLTYGPVSLPYLLAPSDDWLPVRRHEYGASHRNEIVIPAGLDGLPRDPLLVLRLVGGGLYASATTVVSDVTVLVNNVPPNGARLPDHGRLSYVRGPERTDLTYALTPWQDRKMRPGSGLPAGATPSPYRTVISVGPVLGWLDVEPPDPGRRPRERWFEVRAPQFDPDRMPVRSEVLYSTAVTSANGLDGRRWHVKMFRTATPQHADFLRSEFARQAEAVRDVIVNGGGRIDRPPWGIAPVHVINPDDIIGQHPPATSVGPPPPRPPNVDTTLGTWFGDPGALGDCFVVVASPELPPANVDRDPAGPALLQLARFREMATALDRCHHRGIAHCDLKPDNYRLHRGDFVLVDGDSVTELDSEPMTLPFTRPYASAAMLRRHDVTGHTPYPLAKNEIVQHDQLGFGMLVLGAVAGSDWVADAVKDTSNRTVDDPDRLRTALYLRWGQDPRWQPLIDALAEPFDPRRLETQGFTCAAWLSRAEHAAGAPAVEEIRPDPDYRGRYAAQLRAIRVDVTAKNPTQVHQLAAVDEAIATQAARLTARARLAWLAWVGVPSIIVLIWFVLIGHLR